MTPAAPDVHLWRVNLDNDDWEAMAWALSFDERSSAKRFLTPTLQWRYSRCRSVLRHVLARYTSLCPSELIIRHGAFGKPALADIDLHFNVSHSAGWAMIAVSSVAVGVDVELLNRSNVDMWEIAPLLCDHIEQAELLALPPELRNKAMLRLWTRKEAYVKAIGTGLQQSLAALHLIPQGIAGCSKVIGACATDGPAFYAHDIEAPPACVASLCLAAECVSLTYMDAWPEQLMRAKPKSGTFAQAH